MPAKAKLTTRERTSSNVSSDNLNKGSELSHAEADSNFINLRDQTIAISDGSTSTDIEAGETITFSGASVSGNTVTVTAAGVTGSSTTTFTNKTFDADGTGNSLSNIDVANLKSGVLDTDISSVSGSDDTLASAKAIKTYVDANSSSAITVQDEGSSLSTAATTINFVGAGVAATGTGATKTITIGAANANTGDFAFSGNEMSTGSSNADMELSANGTGGIFIQPRGGIADFQGNLFESASTTLSRGAGLPNIFGVADSHTNGTRGYKYDSMYFKLTGSDTSSSNARYRHVNNLTVDYNGLDSTNTSGSRGARMTRDISTTNSSAHAVTVGNHGGFAIWSQVGDDEGGNSKGDIAVTNTGGLSVSNSLVTASGQTLSATTMKGITNTVQSYGSGTANIANVIAYENVQNGQTVSNDVQGLHIQYTNGTVGNDFTGIDLDTAGTSTTGTHYEIYLRNDTKHSNLNNLIVGDNGNGTDKIIKTATSGDNITIQTQGAGNITLDPSGTGNIILGVNGSTPTYVKVGNGSTYGAITSNGDHQLEVSANGGGAAQARITLQNDANGRHVDLDPGTSGTIRLFGTMTGETGSTAMNLDGVAILDNTISANASNSDLKLAPSGTGDIDLDGTARFNTNYKEDIQALTSASSIAVDCSLASVFTVTLAHAATFTFNNLPTGGSVSVIIRQDGSGGRTGAYTNVLFPSNQHTLSTGANDIDIISIFNDGTSLLGNISKDYS
jgi:hypothetical protein